jgi:hypothetical protein
MGGKVEFRIKLFVNLWELFCVHFVAPFPLPSMVGPKFRTPIHFAQFSVREFRIEFENIMDSTFLCPFYKYYLFSEN